MIVDEKTLVSNISETELGIDAPKRYYVIMHNDNTTPIEFVIEVLIKLFNSARIILSWIKIMF